MLSCWMAGWRQLLMAHQGCAALHVLHSCGSVSRAPGASASHQLQHGRHKRNTVIEKTGTAGNKQVPVDR
jgi:hypothetical protein